MPRPITLPSGKKVWQGTYENSKLGIKRTRQNFDTRAEAKRWEAQQAERARNLRFGGRDRRLFGEALSEYLLKESPSKDVPENDFKSAKALRWPVKIERTWYRLEQTAIEPNPENPEEVWIIPALAAWVYDLKQVQKRSYLGGKMFHLRQEGNGLRWYYQPENEDGPIDIRRPVKDPELIRKLNMAKGRGPYTTETLRKRQTLVSQVLNIAARKWHWTTQNYSNLIMYEASSTPKQQAAPYHKLLKLLIHLRPGLDEGALGAVWVGWRRTNLLRLEWSHVVLPVWEESHGERSLLQPGFMWVERTKNKKPVYHPIGPHLEALLLLRWKERRAWKDKAGNKHYYVFHQGNGAPWGDFRKHWAKALQVADLPANFRWHDLRACFATWLLDKGADDRAVMELGGWTDQRTFQDYAKIAHRRLLETTKLQTNGG